MKKQALLFALLIALFALAGCGGSNQSPAGNSGKGEESQQAPELLEPIKVEVRFQPEKPAPGEEVTIAALVTQGNEKVNDAEEVMFEIWQEGSDQHEMIPGEHKGDGVYAVKKRFDKAAIYYVIAHVTARDQHNMPKVKLNVGHVEERAKPENGDQQQGGSQGHDHGHGLSILYKGEKVIRANQDSLLSTQVLKDGKPLAGAAVRFEYWQEGDPQHAFLKAGETADGVYAAKVKLDKKGQYRVKIHVEKEALHEHKEIAIEVKE